MTDGIIQKVYKKIWHEEHDKGNPTYALDKFKQELIEKIRLWQFTDLHKIDLIGDNQE